MAEDANAMLERLNIPKESVVALKLEPGAKYLIVLELHCVTMETYHELTENLGRALNFECAFLRVRGKPDDVISAFKIKEPS